jgi:tRNA threonylcarbamoyl adenosine modification protein YjeE
MPEGFFPAAGRHRMKADYARVDDLAAFERVAAAFAADLRPGEVVALTGDLGAGKTTFVRAVVRALHGRDEASSPTFTFRHTYAGEPPIEHLDLYRIEDPAEARELGLEEAFDGASIVLVEWPERLPQLIPEHAVHVGITGSGDSPRDVVIERR